MQLRLMEDNVDTAQPQVEGAGHTMSAAAGILSEECTILPQDKGPSLETEDEQIGGDTFNGGETQVEEGSPLPSPPTPPQPHPEYGACNIITDDIKGVDTELYYSNVEPNDEGKDSLDTSTSREYPVDDLRDEINLK